MALAQRNNINLKSIGLVAVLFGILLFANHGNELLKQLVLIPGSISQQGISADCREDELEEENISLFECQLLVANIQIALASSPDWFRPAMLFFSFLGSLFALFSVYFGMALVSNSKNSSFLIKICFCALLGIDLLIFIAASNTGPLLRAQYLWPSLIWFFVHIILLTAVIAGPDISPEGTD